MGWHTWFFRPAREGEKPASYCAAGDNYVDTEYADLFRCASSKILRSLDETLAFIEVGNIEITTKNLTKLREFWEKYPDGVIEFG